VTGSCRADRPHTWTFTADVAAMAVLAGRDERAWGRAWHVPSGPPRTQRGAIQDIARAAGIDRVRVREVPAALLRGAGLTSPLMRELIETQYQFREEFVMDSGSAQRTFGLAPTEWDAIVASALRWYRRPDSDLRAPEGDRY
jgi:nucleoside-diphosphate-sugar epimerase